MGWVNVGDLRAAGWISGPEPVRTALVTEGTYPYHLGGVSVWCDQLVRGLDEHDYEVVAIVGSGNERPAWSLPSNVRKLTTMPLWSSVATPRLSSADRGTMVPLLGDLFDALDDATPASFCRVLHRLYLAAQEGLLRPALNSPDTVELVLERMRQRSGPGRPLRWGRRRAAPGPAVANAVEALVLIEHFLRPLGLDPPRADLCHAASNGLASLPALTAKWRHDTPFLLTEHGLYLRERLLANRPGTLDPHVRSVLLRFFKRLVEATYLMADRVAPVSYYCRLWELESGVDASKIHPVHNGIDPARFPFAPDEPDEPTLVFVGRIDPLKDIETLLRSFAIVREAVPGAHLRMFGPRELVTYCRRLDDLADELELEDSAVFEGPVDSPAAAYHAGQIVLLTSISEGFPFAVLEAMACGRPVIATDVGGVAEAVAHCGVMVPPRDPEAVARATIELLRDPGRRRELGRLARDRVVEHFTLKQCIANYRDVYDDIVRPRRVVRLQEALAEGMVSPTFPGPSTTEPAVRPARVPTR